MSNGDQLPLFGDDEDDGEPPDFSDPSEVMPGLAWRDGPDTTIDAAYLAAPAASTQRGRLLVLMHDSADYGLTALEAEGLMLREFPRMRNVRARITELRRGHWLIITGLKRMTDSGAEAYVNYFNPHPLAEVKYQEWLLKEQDE